MSRFTSPPERLRACSIARRLRWLTLRTCAAHHAHTPDPSIHSLFSFLSSSALLNAGHKVSRSHASPGSLKTTASREVIHDVFRAWAQRHPVRLDRISETAPAAKLLSKEFK